MPVDRAMSVCASVCVSVCATVEPASPRQIGHTSLAYLPDHLLSLKRELPFSWPNGDASLCLNTTASLVHCQVATVMSFHFRALSC